VNAVVEADVYVDVLCPWSYIAKRRIEAALVDVTEPERVRLRWRSFELSPDEPRAPSLTAAESMTTWWGERGAARVELIHDAARAEGLGIDLHRARPVNTFDAHRLYQMGAERGLGDAVLERLLRGYLCEGLNVGDPRVLERLGVRAGLDAAQVRDVLAGSAYADRVRADEAEARRRGVNGVPTMTLNGGPPVSALQTSAALRRLLEDGLQAARRTAPGR